MWFISLLPSHPRIQTLPSKALLMFSSAAQLCSPNINSCDKEIWGLCSKVLLDADKQPMPWDLGIIYSNKRMNICYFIDDSNLLLPDLQLVHYNPAPIFYTPPGTQLYLLLSAAHLCCWHPLLFLSWFLQQRAHLPHLSIQGLSNALRWEYWSWPEFSCKTSHKVKDVKRWTFPTSIFINTGFIMN